jgi:adenine/guanine phosphoribosyltransferase-like PRPP-binding protein
MSAGIEARGFIFGAPIALAIGAKFVPMRKPKNLPGNAKQMKKKKKKKKKMMMMMMEEVPFLINALSWVNGLWN